MDEQKNQIIIYNSADGHAKIEVKLENETVWLSQDQMAELFDKSKSTINEHIQNVYSENELQLEGTMRKFGNSELSTKPTNFYNLDMIISVGYRVNSLRGTQFRVWATRWLYHVAQGITRDDKRLSHAAENLSYVETNDEVKRLMDEKMKIYQNEVRYSFGDESHKISHRRVFV